MDAPCFEQLLRCPKCNGLFYDQEEIKAHHSMCTGSALESEAVLFATSKSSFLLLKEETKLEPHHHVSDLTADHSYTSLTAQEADSTETVSREVKCEVTQSGIGDESPRGKRAPTKGRKQRKRVKRTASGRVKLQTVESESEQTAVEVDNAAEYVKVEAEAMTENGEEVDDSSDPKKRKRSQRTEDLCQLTEKYKAFAQTDPSNVVTYHCPDCPKTTKHIGFFNRHMLQCHPPKSSGLWKCDLCDFTTDSKPKFNQHKYRHSKNHMCEVCSRCFSVRRDLQLHMWSHSKEKPFNCEHCDFSTRFPHAFKQHMRKHSGEMLQCDVEGCNFRTAYNWALQCHRNAKHERTVIYRCDLCPFQSTLRSTLIRHQKMHLGLHLYRCVLCSHSAISKHEIVTHMRSHSKEKVFFCDQCDFATSYLSGLRVHLMQHLRLKPFQCSLCPFKAITRQKVRLHQNARHSDHPDAQVVFLGVKLDIDINHFKRRTSECYVVKATNEPVQLEVIDPVRGCVEIEVDEAAEPWVASNEAPSAEGGES